MQEFRYEIVKKPEIFEQNRLPAHSDHDFYRTYDAALAGGDDGFSVSLDGVWYFSYAKNYSSVIRGFWEDSCDCRSWDTIRVPAHIQTEGYDVPQYDNTQYPWEGKNEVGFGEIPEDFNPTACYVRYFTLPDRLKGGDVRICFDGVESAIALWLNGSYVGYSEDTFDPSEFDLTPYLRDGENKLAAMVFKWSGGSWCEDQDMFRFSGIFRSVRLYRVPETHVEDVKLQTELSDDFSEGRLDLCLRLRGTGRVRAALSKNHAEIASAEKKLKPKTSFSLSVKNPDLWSAEDPQLYDLELSVFDADGNLTEVIPEIVGFRRFEMKDHIMTLNGRRIVFKGVNRHEFCAQRGRVVSEELTEQDIRTMKRNNINALRTSHYPNQRFLYRLCDRYGIYLIAEANLESHGTWEAVEQEKIGIDEVIPGNRPEYHELILDRARSLYERCKNHPAILIWSCGNEAFGGSNLYDMSQSFRKWDPFRLVHYEGISHDRRFNDTSDMESSMYEPVAGIRDFLAQHRDKPYIVCEYAHAMGNSCGAISKYTEYAYEEPLFQGGFIWDYIDQSMTLTDSYGKSFQGYGGDFGDRPCDYNFSGNGIVYGEHRDPSPKMQEVRYVYQNIRVEFDGLTAKVINRNLFTDADAYDWFVILQKDGYTIEEKRLDPVSVPPLSDRRIPLPLTLPRQAAEYAVTLSFRLKEDTLWAQAGYEVAYGQCVIEASADDGRQPSACDGFAAAMPAGGLKILHGWDNIGIRGDSFEMIFSTLYGGPISYRFAGRELLSAIPRPNFWRPMTDNDVANQLPFRAGQWLAASRFASTRTEHGRGMTPYEIREEEDFVEVSYDYHLPVRPETDCAVSYRVHPDGTVDVTLRMDPSDAVGELPEFSMLLQTDRRYHHFRWYGFGPEDTYADRAHAKLGIYEKTAQENMAKYLRPQECGLKMGVRRASLLDDAGAGLLFMPNELSVSVLPYLPLEIESAEHPTELPASHMTAVRIGRQMGIGGDDTWGALVHPEFLLDNSRPMEISFSFCGTI